jgi:hypothetical protein
MEKPRKTSLNIPAELWVRARKRAIDEEISAGELVVRALENYLRTPISKKKGSAR